MFNNEFIFPIFDQFFLSEKSMTKKSFLYKKIVFLISTNEVIFSIFLSQRKVINKKTGFFKKRTVSSKCLLMNFFFFSFYD